ncbi:putative metal-binding protein, DUF2103 family [Halanaeroarchaeum sp. HSR-CO]|uniref:DUF2103 domain-containing protein n=1 Tax=Halanaeroarchaeum sp. HSR-CO TaxID=2866382 RepID=UPI00217E63A9|nr:DUF2103 domain-containing protein [Halanaeroarchaeum sp. HSR-CO]UWG47202.1 putative metal-binding protein, DUF2103 family [Halanaeroarchaeum sp. HSR-CO]
MQCGHCGRSLDRPGDYCLVCDGQNADAVVVSVADSRATLTILDGETVLGETHVTTVPETDEELSTVQHRNFAGRIADEIRRKRPEAVYAAGDLDVITAVRADLHYPVYRVPNSDPVAAVLDRRGDRDLAVVEKPAAAKIGGAHSTVIGNRDGERAITTIAGHPHVKKIIPGPIDAGGSGSRTGVRAKATRADNNGNVRLLIRDGSSVQENRIVTTAMDRETGERVRDDLNRALSEADLREET